MRAVRTKEWWFAAILLSVSMAPLALAERAAVLRQIDVPHDYYYREMYLPQVSSGPQSPTWSPDGQSLVYAMQGSLWRQSLGSATAVQLTAGPGYDHQPDWSPDGQKIAFTRYNNDALELQLLDVQSGAVTPITSGGDVNVEPRWSPDGSQLAFVSTKGTGRFHVFTGRLVGEGIEAAPLLAERRSATPRYYYSEFDHELHPVWTPDGKTLLYVSNPEIAYGSGALWQQPLDDPSARRLVRNEETTWRMRPDVAPDGRRVIYSSYLGRQWHQLWITAIDGKGEPFPLTYGDFDVSSARWSPDGTKIAFISNATGSTSLKVLQVPGGKLSNIDVDEREYLRPTGTLRLSVVDIRGKAIPGRVSITGADGRAYAPADRRVHADDSFDRALQTAETRYFHVNDAVSIDLPAGPATITVWHGLETSIEQRQVDILPNRNVRLRMPLRRLDLPAEWNGWQSADVHVHMNYGGTYRNMPQNLVQQAAAEDLDVVFNLVVNKEQRVPDVGYFSTVADAASTGQVVVQHAQEFHTGYWGHLGLLGLSDHLLLPDYSAYAETAAASIYPDNASVADMAHAQGAVVGYVHPFLYPLPDPATDAALTNALPVDAALGKVDYYEVIGFADHRASADIWYRLLNCGFRIAAAGGTDAMANFASLRGPLGVNRTYVPAAAWPDEPNARRDAWIDGLRKGRSLATNGPLLGLSVDGEGPGAVVDFTGQRRINYRGFLRSIIPLDRLELVWNGRVVRSISLASDAQAVDFDGTFEANESGWLLVRADSVDPHPGIFDMYPYATTSPIYFDRDGSGARSAEDAAYFLAWVERVRAAATAHPDFNSSAERTQVLKSIDSAAAVYRQRLE